jgi:hypothetical protein
MNREVNDADLALRVYEGSVGALVEDPKNFAALAKELRANLQRSRPDDVVRFITERQLSPRVLREFGLGWDGHRIAFPYYDDEEVFGVKYRDRNGNKTSETGSRRGIYNVNDVRFKPYVILCEGESDTLAVWSHIHERYIVDITEKVGVGGIPGVSGSKSTWEVWALDLLWAKKVFVAFDADEAGDNGVIMPMQAIGEKAVRMRPTMGKDMTDHFLAGGYIDDFPELAGELRLLA